MISPNPAMERRSGINEFLEDQVPGASVKGPDLGKTGFN
jgi:hypothetical protein